MLRACFVAWPYFIFPVVLSLVVYHTVANSPQRAILGVMHTLQEYGWNDERATTWRQLEYEGVVPARIVADYGQAYRVATPEQLSARLAGSLAHKLKTIEMPKIGDWVAVELRGEEVAIIQAVLPRTTEIVRGQAGRLLDKQVIAANVDLAFVVQPLDHDFSVERLERYIFQLSSQRISTIILLNKADVATDLADKQAQLARLDVPHLVMSATQDETVAAVEQFIKQGQTAVIMGSSGAGKSTLVNRLLKEERQATAAIRERDSKGRHTTVHRELFVLPGGGMIIDTPGVRELQLWGNVDDLRESFSDIVATMNQCRFRNCSHTNEAGCAVTTGLADGLIDGARYRTYLNFTRELEGLEARREFIEERRTQQSKASAKRRQRRAAENSPSEDW